MIKVVIDTNVFISSKLSPMGSPAFIMKLVADDELEFYYNREILEEYERVLSYKKLKISVVEQKNAVDTIKSIGIFVIPVRSNVPFIDETDRIFYDTAKVAGAILITGNIKHYPEENFIMSPAHFWGIWNKK